MMPSLATMRAKKQCNFVAYGVYTLMNHEVRWLAILWLVSAQPRNPGEDSRAGHDEGQEAKRPRGM